MTRIVICGGPRTGKTTLARDLMERERIAVGCSFHTDDLIEQTKHLGKDGWSEASRLASEWLDAPGPWIIEGVAMSRALRKWREAHPGEPPPVDRVIRLTEPHVTLTPGQTAMAKGEETVWREVGPWLFANGIHPDHPTIGLHSSQLPNRAWPTSHEADCEAVSGGGCSCPMGNL